MTPATTGGKRGGNLELDRQVRQLGKTREERRIRVTVGSTDPKIHRRADAIIDKLIEGQRFDVLRALQAGTITVPDLIAADRKGKPSKSIAGAEPHAAASYWVLAITGVRVGEYLASSKANLDPAGLTYTVPSAAKNDMGDFPLRVDPRWWVYIERGIPSRLQYKWLRIHWKRACGKAGVSGITLHDLRHCHGQWAINAKVEESKVQGSLRHENPAQTRDYVMQSGTLDVSSALADAILGAATPTPTKRRRA